MSTSGGNLIIVAFVLQVALGILAGIAGFWAGLLGGAFIGGNVGFFPFAGSVGYEAAGIFFAYIGVGIGVFLGVLAGGAVVRFPVAKIPAFVGAFFLPFLCLTIFQMTAASFWIYVFIVLSAVFSAVGAHFSWLMVKRG